MELFKSKFYAFAALCVLAALPMTSFAQSAGDFDGQEIIAKITTYGGVGVLIIGALLLARWGMKALGILK